MPAELVIVTFLTSIDTGHSDGESPRCCDGFYLYEKLISYAIQIVIIGGQRREGTSDRSHQDLGLY